MSRKDNPVSPDEVREITVKKPKNPQWYQVFVYMVEHGSITPMQAVKDLGCMRLAARVADIEKHGIIVNRKPIEVRNRFGRICRVMSYSLEETV